MQACITTFGYDIIPIKIKLHLLSFSVAESLGMRRGYSEKNISFTEITDSTENNRHQITDVNACVLNCNGIVT